jgi:tetratricopeptide (TPR) repeat protein
MYLNPKNDGAFVNVAFGLDLDFDDDGRAALPIDIDGDGDLDLAVMSLQALHLAENRSAPKDQHFVRINLRATQSQHHALGANVSVLTGARRQQDFVKAISGFQTQVPLELHFGLGGATHVDEIEVRWPSGKVERFLDPPIDRKLTIVEGSTLTSERVKSWPQNALLSARPSYDLKSPVARLDSKAVPTLPLAELGKPALINFWAPWCKPCVKELPVLKRLSDHYRDQVGFHGVSVEMKDLDSVRSSIKRFSLDYDQTIADTILLESFFGPGGSAALPATFLFDATGALVRAFRRPVDESDLHAVIDSLLNEKPDVPYLLVLGEAAIRRQDFAAAAEYFEQALKVEPNNPYVLTQYGTILSIGGDHKRSIETLKKVLLADPGFHYAWAQLGLSHKRRDSFSKALKAYENAVAINPENVSYLVQVSTLLIRLKKFESAEKRLMQITALEPKEFDAWLNLGRVRSALNKVSAREAFESARSIQPQNPELLRLIEALP